MTAIRTMIGWAALLALVACNSSDRPNIGMIAEVNALSLTTADTLVVSRALTNNGASDIWLNASAPAFELLDAAGQPACYMSTSLALTQLELVRLMPDSTLLDTREYPLADRVNCEPGAYTISIVATFHTAQEGGEVVTIRTGASAFTLSEPPVVSSVRSVTRR